MLILTDTVYADSNGGLLELLDPGSWNVEFRRKVRMITRRVDLQRLVTADGGASIYIYLDGGCWSDIPMKHALGCVSCVSCRARFNLAMDTSSLLINAKQARVPQSFRGRSGVPRIPRTASSGSKRGNG